MGEREGMEHKSSLKFWHFLDEIIRKKGHIVPQVSLSNWYEVIL